MKKFKSILIAILAVLPAIYTSLAVFFMLPDTVAAHFNVHGQVDRYGSKYEAFLLPAIILVMYVICMIVRTITLRSSTDDDKTARNLDVGDTIVLLLLVLLDAVDVLGLLAMGGLDVFSDTGSPASVIISAIMGIVFIILGNIMPKTKPNAFLGMRLSFAMDTDEHWYIANRAGGIAMVLAGLVTIIAGLIFRSLTSVFAAAVSLIVFLTVASIYSYVIIKRRK